jgi:hypothetical protein
MATKRTIWTQRVLDECGDEWRPLEDVISIALLTVPPGKALRKYEGRSDRRQGIKPLTEDEKIRSGARFFVVNSVRNLTNSRQIETTVINGVKMVRYVPGADAARSAAIHEAGVCPHCLRPYDMPEEVVPPFLDPIRAGAKVIFPPQFNQRRFG